MSAALLVAGGAVGHKDGVRLWAEDADRFVHWWGEDPQPRLIRTPVPGSQGVITCDVWSLDPLTVLASGEVIRCHASTRSQSWHGAGRVAAEPLVLATFVRRGDGGWNLIAAVTDKRQIVCTDERLVPATRIGGPIPGDSRVLAVRLVAGGGAEVLMSDGQFRVWRARGWSSSAGMPSRDLVAAGVETRSNGAPRWWAVARDRRVLVADGCELPDAACWGTVPGSSAIITARTWGRGHADVLVASGEIVSAFATEVTA